MTRRWALAVAGAVLASGLALPTHGTPASAASAGCANTQLGQPAGMAGSGVGVPVVLVHGMNGSVSQWTTGSHPLAARIADIAGASVWTFDYHQWSLDWVDNPHIGPELARDLACLRHASGHKVIVVAHSMGGLAAQYAVAQRDPHGGTVAGDVEEVLTLGTPYQGSALLSALKFGIGQLRGALALGVQAILAACAGVTDLARSRGIENTPCDTAAVADNPVGTDLEYHSAAIAALPHWPPGLLVKDLAGQTEVSVGVNTGWGDYGVSQDVGDVIVTTGSATAHDTDGTAHVATCTLGVLKAINITGTNPCYHGHLMDNPVLTNPIMQIIERDTGSSISMPCTAANLFSAAAAKEHFSADDPSYKQLSAEGSGPTVYGVRCDGDWALGLVSRPNVGTTDGGTLFQRIGGRWTETTTYGGEGVAPCQLVQDGVPAATARDLSLHMPQPPDVSC